MTKVDKSITLYYKSQSQESFDTLSIVSSVENRHWNTKKYHSGEEGILTIIVITIVDELLRGSIDRQTSSYTISDYIN